MLSVQFFENSFAEPQANLQLNLSTEVVLLIYRVMVHFYYSFLKISGEILQLIWFLKHFSRSILAKMIWTAEPEAKATC